MYVSEYDFNRSCSYNLTSGFGANTELVNLVVRRLRYRQVAVVRLGGNV
jgi:hypothetical protein